MFYRFSLYGHAAGTFCIFLNSHCWGRVVPLTRPARHLSPLWSEGIYERAHSSDQSLFCKPTNHRRLSQHYPSTDVAGFLLNWDTSAPGFDYFVFQCKHLWLDFVEKCQVPDTIASDIHKYVKLGEPDCFWRREQNVSVEVIGFSLLNRINDKCPL